MNKIKKRISQIKILLKYFYFKFYCYFKKINNDDLWIISERGYDARDNSYHLFKYICKNHPEINIKYVISSDSPDYDKVKKIGGVIEYGSKEHYIAFITAGMLISTHIMGFSPNAGLFSKLCEKKKLKVNGKYISLRHGIIKDFLPSLIADKTNLSLFVTTAKPEYQFVLDKFGYSDEIVKCTGLARYDNLVNNQKNQILVMPTFRKWMSYYSRNEFIQSDYYLTFNSLLNNDELIELLEKENCILYFYPHFEIQKFIDCFSSKSKNIVIADMKNYDVQQLLIDSKFMITDYSSVFFDFAYMLKPLIYYQFDKEKYRNGHYQEGYFSYENNGFGPVVFKEKELVDYIKKMSINNYELDNQYKDRVTSFFKYTDKNNCERIFKEILKLTNK